MERVSRTRRFELSVDRFALRSGEATAILGPNGAGKTTLLLAMAGLLEPQAGRVLGGSGSVTMVFQRPIPFAGSVASNIGTALLGKRLGAAEVAARVEAELERFGLTSLRDQSARRLSGGELRRLALARGMALHPEALLLDEPFDDLDVEAQALLAGDVARMVKDTGVALALVTHDLQRATSIADRIAVVLEGRIEQIGAARDVLERPADVAVARLVGMSNLLPGVVSSEGEGFAEVTVGEGGHVQAAGSLEEGSPVWVGIRPERLKLDLGRGDSVLIGDATIVSLVADSVLTRVTLRWAGLEVRTHLLSGRGPSRGLAVGDVVGLSLQPEDVHLMPRRL